MQFPIKVSFTIEDKSRYLASFIYCCSGKLLSLHSKPYFMYQKIQKQLLSDFSPYDERENCKKETNF